jgi:hypothetical protein
MKMFLKIIMQYHASFRLKVSVHSRYLKLEANNEMYRT